DVFRNDGGAFTRLTGGAGPFAAAPLATTDWETAYLLAGDHDGDGDMDVYNHADDRFYVQAGSAPVLATRTPARGTTDVPVGSTLTLTFDEPVVLGSGDLVLRDVATGAVLERVSAGADADRFAGTGTATVTI